MHFQRGSVSILILIISLSGCLTVNNKHPEMIPNTTQSLDIYLLIGQSNMAGRAPYSAEKSGPIPGCVLLDSSGRWVPAANPLNRYSSIRKGMHKQKMNPGYRFAEVMLEKEPGNRIGLVVNARGGSAIEEWDTGSKYYGEALRRVSEAQKSGTLRGILWHQGEANVHAPDGYIEKLVELVQRFRADLGIPDLPFVAGQIDRVPEINDQITLLPSRLPATGYVSSEGLVVFEEWHFDANSVRIMGERYAEEIIRINGGRW